MAIVLVGAVIGCGRQQQEKPATAVPPPAPAVTGTAEGTLTIRGSDTMLQVGQALAETFMQQNPKATINVTGGGSGTGIKALIDGTCDIAHASRQVKEKEIERAQDKGRDPNEIQVGSDGLAVIVSKDNPVSELTIGQLADIFTAKVKNWKEVGGNDAEIVLLSRDFGSGTHVYFKEHVLNRGDSKGKAEYAPSALLLQSNDQIHDEVEANAKAIGYVGLGYVDDAVKPVGVAAAEGHPFVAPSMETVVSGEYPVARPLFFYAAGEPEGLVKTYVDWVLGPEGQKVVEEQGFVPVTSAG